MYAFSYVNCQNDELFITVKRSLIYQHPQSNIISLYIGVFSVVAIPLYNITRDTPKLNILQTQENYYDAHTKQHNMQNFMCKHPFFSKQFPCICLMLNHLLMCLIQSLPGISYKNGLKLNNKFSK